MNFPMHKMVKSGEALDVREIGIVADGEQQKPLPEVFLIAKFTEGLDYCDLQTERWIWSIGRHVRSRTAYAATDTRFYQNPEFECLWLR